jgi:hypothetical protein
VVRLIARENAQPIHQRPSTADVGKFEWFTIIIETLDNTEYLWIPYQTCFQSVGLNIQVPSITIYPPPSFQPMAPWTFTSPLDNQVCELVFYILYSINIIKNHLLYLGQSHHFVVSHSIDYCGSTWWIGGWVRELIFPRALHQTVVDITHLSIL